MIYTAIFRVNTILADYSEDQGDFPTITMKILKANRQNLEFYVIPYLNYDFYFLHKDDYTFTSITESNLDNEKILVFLQNLMERYLTLCRDEKDNLTYKTTSLIRDLMVIQG